MTIKNKTDRVKLKPKRKNLSTKVLRKIKSTRDKHIRLKIIKGIIRVDSRWTSHVLLSSLDDPCENIRDHIIRELGNRNNYKLELLYKRLGTPPWYLKSSCLKILGFKKDPNSVKHIAPCLNEPNVDVRITAAQLLGDIGGREALALLAKLVKDKNRFVRISAEKALLKASDIKFI